MIFDKPSVCRPRFPASRRARTAGDPTADRAPSPPADAAAADGGESDCVALAAELEYAKLEIAALEHDNELLASENKILANERDLPQVVADIREYLGHVVDGDDIVAPGPS